MGDVVKNARRTISPYVDLSARLSGRAIKHLCNFLIDKLLEGLNDRALVLRFEEELH